MFDLPVQGMGGTIWRWMGWDGWMDGWDGYHRSYFIGVLRATSLQIIIINIIIMINGLALLISCWIMNLLPALVSFLPDKLGQQFANHRTSGKQRKMRKNLIYFQFLPKNLVSDLPTTEHPGNIRKWIKRNSRDPKQDKCNQLAKHYVWIYLIGVHEEWYCAIFWRKEYMPSVCFNLRRQ